MAIERSDGAARERWIKSGTLGAGAILAFALLVLVNYLGGKYYKRFDWTSTSLYSLSEKSLNVVRSLDRDIEAVALMSPAAPLHDPVRELLARYEAESPHFSVRFVDPDKNLVEARSLVERFDLSQLDVVVFDSGDDRRVVDSADLAEYDYSGLQLGQGPEMTGFNGEQIFTSTLIELTEGRKPKILFTSGHGERSLDDFGATGLDQAQTLLGQDNLEVEEWASLGQIAVPDGTDLVVIAGPTSSFVEPELEVLRSYLEGGGRLMALIDPGLTPAGEIKDLGLEALLREFGIEVGADIVIDPANPLPFFGAETIVVSSYGSHPITRSLDQAQVPVIFPLSRSVAAADAADAAEGFEITELLRTSGEGWGERNLTDLQGIAQDDDDLDGPVPLALAVRLAEDEAEESAPAEESSIETPGEDEDGEGEGEDSAVDEPAETADMRMVVFGDSDFFTNGQLANVGNAELFINTINWLVERENLVGIPPKKPEQVRLTLTGSQMRNLSLLVFVVLPGLAVLAGTAVYFRRRR